MGKPEFRRFKDEYINFKLSTNRILANADAIFDTDTRALPNNGKVYDLFDNTNDYSCGKLDTTATTTTSAMTAGVSFLPVASATGFTKGQEVTVYDDVGQEDVAITTSGNFSVNGATIAATATDAGYNNYPTYAQGRHLLMLNNGALVSAWMDSSSIIYLSKSVDGGATWSVLTTIGTFSAGQPYFGISTDGTYIHFLVTWSIFIGYRKFDVAGTTITRNDTLDAAITGAAPGCSIEVGLNGTVHAVWSCVVAAYPNSKNLRYANSSDGGVTWSAIAQLTTDNTSGYTNQQPCLVINANSKPVVLFEYAPASSQRTLYSMIYTTSWSAKTYIYSLGSSGGMASWPSAVRDSSGTIHIAFSSSFSAGNMSYNKSTDGGVSWFGNTDLYTNSSYLQYAPSIAVDKSNNVYVAWVDARNSTTVQMISYISGSWGSKSSYVTGYAPKLIANNNLSCTAMPIMYMNVGMQFKGTFINNIFGISGVTTNAYKLGAVVTRSSVTLSGNKMNFNNFVITGATTPVDKSTPVTAASGLAASNDYTNWGNGRKVVVGNNGNIYIAYYNLVSGYGQIYVEKSTDGGSTWSDMGFPLFPGSYYQQAPSIAIDSSNNLHIVWMGYDSTYSSLPNIKYCKYNGSSWGSVIYLTTGNTYSQNSPAMCIDPSGNLHAVWSGQSSSYGTVNIQYSKYSNGSWSSPIFITTEGSYAQSFPCVVCDSLTNIHVIWYGADSTYTTKSNIKHKKYSGGSWGSISYLTTGTSLFNDYPSMTADSAGNVHVAWSRYYSGTQTIGYCKYNGTSWGSVVVAMTGTYSYTNSSIAIDNTAKLHITFQGGDATYNPQNIKYTSSADGVTWSGWVNWTTSSVATNNQDYCILCDNYTNFTQPLAIWSDYKNGNIKFRGVFNWTPVTTTPKLTGVARYNITPSLPTFSDIAMWIQHDRATPDSNFTVAGAISINDVGANESYNSMTQTTTNLSASTAEEQLLNTVSTPKASGCLKVTMTRANGSISPTITKIIGAID